MPFNMDDYVDVAERITLFYEKYPDGGIQTVSVEYREWPTPGILATAKAYRSKDDLHPALGTAWEPVPGKTSFTKDSEVQNAETAAWGRAIVAAGIGAKKVASKQDVRNRIGIESTASHIVEEAKRAAEQRGTADMKRPPDQKGLITDAQRRKLFAAGKGYGLADDEIKAIVKLIAGVDSTKEIPRYKVDAVLKEIEVQGMGASA